MKIGLMESHERQQQIIQSTIPPEILSIPPEPSSLLTLPENSNQIERDISHLESTTFPNTEIKKRRSKSRSKSVHISDSIPTNNSTEKISSEDLDALYEKEARRDEKNKANMTRLLTTT